jgi:succinate dehydrogenase/fumarate reductase iron-sulfur protein
MITLSIQRASGEYAKFEVEHREGMSILDALREISADGADIAYRWECGGQGICGVCTMNINGTPKLACTTHAQPGGSYTLEPLEGFPIEKDLLVDFAPRITQMDAIQPYLVEGGAPIETKAQADAGKLQRSCIESWACLAVCPVSLETDAMHAVGMLKLARFELDPRDGADRAALAEKFGIEKYAQTCPSCRRCMDICPKGIDIYVDAIQVLTGAAQHER